MSRETRVEKARRLRDDYRVAIACGPHGLSATVLGDHAEYQLRLTPSGWRCPCLARMCDCSHVLAVERVTGWRR